MSLTEYTSPEDFKRTSTFGMDIVTIFNAELIQKLSEHPDLTRSGQAKLHPLLRLYFPSSKFLHPGTGCWAPAVLPDGADEQVERSGQTTQDLAKGFTPAQIDRIDALIKGNEDAREIGAKLAKLVAEVTLPLKEDEELPDNVAYASCDTLREVPEMFVPWKYFSARRARATAEKWVERRFPDCQNPVDVVHNLGAAAQGLAEAVMLLRTAGNEEYIPFICKTGLLEKVPRFPLRNSTLDGLLPEEKPLQPGKSTVTMMIGTAATKTKDPRFLFGVGTDHRQCPFKPHFLSMINQIREKNMGCQ